MAGRPELVTEKQLHKLAEGDALKITRGPMRKRVVRVLTVTRQLSAFDAKTERVTGARLRYEEGGHEWDVTPEMLRKRYVRLK